MLSFVDQTFSVTTVPEPSSLVLMGTGSVVGVLGVLWRRRRAA